MTNEYKADLSKHASQTDAAKGFGGRYGVQKDRVDKSAVDWSYKEKLQAHQSQLGNDSKNSNVLTLRGYCLPFNIITSCKTRSFL